MFIGTSLYKYGDGTEKPKIHLVADEGKALTDNNEDFWHCVDVDSIDGWVEVDFQPPVLCEYE